MTKAFHRLAALPRPAADPVNPVPLRPEGPWKTRPPRRDSAMSEHRDREDRPTVTPQRYLVASTETARAAST